MNPDRDSVISGIGEFNSLVDYPYPAIGKEVFFMRTFDGPGDFEAEDNSSFSEIYSTPGETFSELFRFMLGSNCFVYSVYKTGALAAFP